MLSHSDSEQHFFHPRQSALKIFFHEFLDENFHIRLAPMSLASCCSHLFCLAVRDALNLASGPATILTSVALSLGDTASACLACTQNTVLAYARYDLNLK